MYTQVKPTKTEEKQKLRKIYRKCRDKENESLKAIVPKAILQEDESIKSYQRKRMLDTPPDNAQRLTKLCKRYVGQRGSDTRAL